MVEILDSLIATIAVVLIVNLIVQAIQGRNQMVRLRHLEIEEWIC